MCQDLSVSQRGDSRSAPIRVIGSQYFRQQLLRKQIYIVLWDHKHEQCWPPDQAIWSCPRSHSGNQGSRRVHKLLFERYQRAAASRGKGKECPLACIPFFCPKPEACPSGRSWRQPKGREIVGVFQPTIGAGGRWRWQPDRNCCLAVGVPWNIGALAPWPLKSGVQGAPLGQQPLNPRKQTKNRSTRHHEKPPPRSAGAQVSSVFITPCRVSRCSRDWLSGLPSLLKFWPGNSSALVLMCFQVDVFNIFVQFFRFSSVLGLVGFT